MDTYDIFRKLSVGAQFKKAHSRGKVMYMAFIIIIFHLTYF